MAESVSDIVSISAPDLVGVWVFDPLDPDGTERNYLYANGRSINLEPDEASIQLAGDRNPLLEYGESTTVVVKTNILVPFDDDHDAGVQWWEDAVLARRTINYRDNRGRLYWVGIRGGFNPTDVREGTQIAVRLQRVDYDESVL